MRLIDADALKVTIANHEQNVYGLGYVNALINEAPTIDNAPVVRCKDCYYHEIAEYDNGTKNVCRFINKAVQDDDFCAWGTY